MATDWPRRSSSRAITTTTFIEARFNHHYPQHAGHFARVIDHYAAYPQSLLDDFARKDKAPHVAISVDMLDTGIDVPEVANLVFFKPVYSRIKFWKMIGRGTRLCPNLFGPADDKHDFRVFDFCFNLDFFRENPEGIEGDGGDFLRARLFRSRVQLLSRVQATPDLDPEAALAGSLTTALHREVAAMNRENFIVRVQLEAVERFRERESRTASSGPTRGSWDGRGRQRGSMPRLRARRRYRSLRAPGDKRGWNGAASVSVSVLGV